MAWQHGASGYRNYGCKCRICRDSFAQEMRAYRQRRMKRRGERMLNGRFVPAAVPASSGSGP